MTSIRRAAASLAAFFWACLFALAADGATSSVHIEWVRGTTVYGAQSLSSSGTEAASSGAPAFDSGGQEGGVAVITATQGASIVAVGPGASATQTNGVYILVGEGPLNLSVSPGDVVSIIAATDQPTAPAGANVNAAESGSWSVGLTGTLPAFAAPPAVAQSGSWLVGQSGAPWQIEGATTDAGSSTGVDPILLAGVNGTTAYDLGTGTQGAGSGQGPRNLDVTMLCPYTSGGTATSSGQFGNCENDAAGNHLVNGANFTGTNITSAATTTARSGAGFFHTLTVNTCVASATITLYDNTAASGTKIATLTLPSTCANPFTVLYDRALTTGLTLVTSGATDLTVTTR